MLPRERGFFEALIGDGRPLLAVAGLALILSGAFALFLSATGHFLPHDERYLGMSAEELCAHNGCRIVHFMFHDRVSFGGALIAIGTLYLWLVEFPLREGRAWAWWTLAISSVVGFASFLTYLGYGYLDTWHGVATLALLPCFIVGLARSWKLVQPPRGFRSHLAPAGVWSWRTAEGFGRSALLATAIGMIGGGLTIMTVGMTSVFVPQDLAYMGVKAEDVRAINDRLVPLIAHDRAGFGGGVAACGVIVLLCVWCSSMSRSLWQALAFAGAVGFACAVGVHPLIGYNDTLHLAPAVLGAAAFIAGMVFTARVSVPPAAVEEISR